MIQEAPQLRPTKSWQIAEWALFTIWVTAALSTMYPTFGRMLHLYGGFFTSYAADLTNPAWLYIVLRSGRRKHRFTRWIGRSPDMAAGTIFVGGVLSELSQLLWPRGMFAGTFDPFDIAAFGAGLLVCYVADRRELRRPVLARSAPPTPAA